jgi:membrane-associated phospholipid phosphatase
VALSVVATGNHYVFDIAAGLLVSVAGYVVGTRVSRLVETRSLTVPRLRLRPTVAEAPA